MLSEALNHDLERVASCLQQPFVVTLRTDDEEKEITVFPSQCVHEVIAGEFADGAIQAVALGENEVVYGDTFDDLGCDDGARLDVAFRKAKTVQQVVAELCELNPERGLYADSILHFIKVDPANPSRIKGHVDWSCMKVTTLPESVADLTIAGDFDVSNNDLSSLPSTIGCCCTPFAPTTPHGPAHTARRTSSRCRQPRPRKRLQPRVPSRD